MPERSTLIVEPFLDFGLFLVLTETNRIDTDRAVDDVDETVLKLKTIRGWPRRSRCGCRFEWMELSAGLGALQCGTPTCRTHVRLLLEAIIELETLPADVDGAVDDVDKTVLMNTNSAPPPSS